eukprot:2658918-Rhodomonas_salina.1
MIVLLLQISATIEPSAWKITCCSVDGSAEFGFLTVHCQRYSAGCTLLMVAASCNSRLPFQVSPLWFAGTLPLAASAWCQWWLRVVSVGLL